MADSTTTDALDLTPTLESIREFRRYNDGFRWYMLMNTGFMVLMWLAYFALPDTVKFIACYSGCGLILTLVLAHYNSERDLLS